MHCPIRSSSSRLIQSLVSPSLPRSLARSLSLRVCARARTLECRMHAHGCVLDCSVPCKIREERRGLRGAQARAHLIQRSPKHAARHAYRLHDPSIPAYSANHNRARTRNARAGSQGEAQHGKRQVVPRAAAPPAVRCGSGGGGGGGSGSDGAERSGQRSASDVELAAGVRRLRWNARMPSTPRLQSRAVPQPNGIWPTTAGSA